jgi:excisionase family DNA binding protein
MGQIRGNSNERPFTVKLKRDNPGRLRLGNLSPSGVVDKLKRNERSRQVVPQDSPVLLDDEGVAAYLCISVRQVKHMAFTRQLPFVKVGRFRRYRIAELERYIEAHRVDAI